MIAGIQTAGIEWGLGELRRRVDELANNELANITGRDLDETRRLLYMVLMRARTDRYVLAGTLVNALCHHNLMLDVDDTMKRVGDLFAWATREDEEEARAWARDLINQLSARTEDAASED